MLLAPLPFRRINVGVGMMAHSTDTEARLAFRYNASPRVSC